MTCNLLSGKKGIIFGAQDNKSIAWKVAEKVCEEGVMIPLTVSQSPTPTTATSLIKDMDAIMDYAGRMSPLGNATAEECAGFCTLLFSDLTRKVTMQNIFHDGGFSAMGMSHSVMEPYSQGTKERP